jgi:hypothetical protein
MSDGNYMYIVVGRTTRKRQNAKSELQRQIKLKSILNKTILESSRVDQNRVRFWAFAGTVKNFYFHERLAFLG